MAGSTSGTGAGFCCNRRRITNTTSPSPSAKATYGPTTPAVPGGTTRTSWPCSWTNWSRIWLSFIPDCSIWAIFCLFALHSGQPGCIWQAIFCLQPQLHFSFAAMALISLVSHWGAVWAHASAARIAASKLTLNLFMRSCNPHDFGLRVHQPGLARDQTDKRAGQHHPIPDPDPAHQRKHVGIQHHRVLIRIRGARKVHVQIFVQPPPDGDLGGWLVGGDVESPLGRQHTQRLAILRGIQRHSPPAVIGVLALLDARQPQTVAADARHLPRRDLDLQVLIERRAGKADKHKHDAHVHDVAAVAPGIAMR